MKRKPIVYLISFITLACAQLSFADSYGDFQTAFQSATVPTESQLQPVLPMDCSGFTYKGQASIDYINRSLVFIPFRGSILRLSIKNNKIQHRIPYTEFSITANRDYADVGAGRFNYIRQDSQGNIWIEKTSVRSDERGAPAAISASGQSAIGYTRCVPNDL